jgi:hypothetical protein
MSERDRTAARAWSRSVAAVMARPSLWPTALRVWARATPKHWWAHPPYVPVPDPAYIRFRLETAYGPDVTPAPDDLVAYLRWCRERAAIRRAARNR